MKRGRRNTLASGLILAAAAAWACSDEPVGVGTRDGSSIGPAFHVQPSPVIRVTGGGRFDFPPGTPGGPQEKNTPESRDFQTFGFNIFNEDKNGDGCLDAQIQYVDHRPSQRIDGRPLNIHSVCIRTFIAPADSECDEGKVTAIGTFEIRNTGRVLEGQVRVCDDGEPGNQIPGDPEDAPDHFHISHVEGYRAEGFLTGGNIQTHFAKP